MESIMPIHKKKRMSHIFILLMKLINYLCMMMTNISINIIHHFYHKRKMKMYVQDQNMIQ